MTPSLDRAVEAAWPEFASSMEMDDPRFADPGRKERLRRIIAAALPHLSPGVEKVKDWRWTLQKAVNRNAGHRCEYRVAAEAVIASMTAIIDNKQEGA